MANMRIARVTIGTLALIASASAQRVSDVRVDRDVAAFSEDPRVAAVGSTVYAVWRDARHNGFDIYFNRSSDAGVTWEPIDVRINTGPDRQATHPEIAAVGSNVFVCWEDDRTSRGHVRFNYSTDSGATWLGQDIQLDHRPPNHDCYLPQIAATDSHVFVAWQDTRLGARAIFLNVSSDGGASWQPSDTQVSDAPGAAGLHMVADGDDVFLTWHDNRNVFFEIFFDRSLDGGTTWLPSDARVDTGTGAGNSGGARVALSGSSVYVAWMSNLTPRWHIRMNYSTDLGANWQNSDILVDRRPPNRDCRNPEVAADGTSVFVTWRDTRNDPAGQIYDIYLNRSTDGGASWQATDVRLNTSPPGTTNSVEPQIHAQGSNVYVTWKDSRDVRSDIYCNYSTDGGATWLPSEFRLDTDGAGAALSIDHDMAVVGSAVHVVWSDLRNGDYDTYYNSFGATEVPAGCMGEPSPICQGVPSASGWFSIESPSPATPCASSTVVLFGSVPPAPVLVPATIGCGTCELFINPTWGVVASPLVVGPGLSPGFEFIAQSACIAVPTLGAPCIDLSGALRVTVAP